MRYFVIAADGNKYGPVDESGLRVWVGEGRVSTNTMLEEEGTGRQVQANMISGLFPTAAVQAPSAPRPEGGPASPYASPYAAGPGGPISGYPRGVAPTLPNVLPKAIFSLLCCCMPGGIVSLIMFLMAQSKLNSGDYNGATSLAQSADKWANASIIVGVVGNILGAILEVLAILAKAH